MELYVATRNGLLMLSVVAVFCCAGALGGDLFLSPAGSSDSLYAVLS